MFRIKKKKPVLRRGARADTPEVRGLNLDPQTRCLHYHTQADIIAIKMKCCATYYACKDCHIALAGHAIEVWPRSEWNQEAILCGACAQSSRFPNTCNASLGARSVPPPSIPDAETITIFILRKSSNRRLRRPSAP
jgi:uncharacterized CHY-type Zn-finger protein